VKEKKITMITLVTASEEVTAPKLKSVVIGTCLAMTLLLSINGLKQDYSKLDQGYL